MENGYQAVLNLKNEYGWTNEQWSEKLRVDKEHLDAIENGSFKYDDELYEFLIDSTRREKAKEDKRIYFPKTIVVAVCIHKGGSGKTTLSMGITEALAEQGYRVLLIDSDSQMDATSTFALDSDTSRKNLYMTLATSDDIRNHISKTPYDNIDIVASDTKMGSIEAMLMSQNNIDRNSVNTFKECMKGVIHDRYYDFVIVDMDKNIGFLSRAILSGCDAMLMVAECAFYHINGAVVMSSQFDDVKRTTNPDIQKLGIILNKVTKRKSIVKQVEESIDELFPGQRYQNTVSMDANIEKAQWNNIPIGIYNKKSKGYCDIQTVTQEFLERAKKMYTEGKS